VVTADFRAPPRGPVVAVICADRLALLDLGLLLEKDKPNWILVIAQQGRPSYSRTMRKCWLQQPAMATTTKGAALRGEMPPGLTKTCARTKGANCFAKRKDVGRRPIEVLSGRWLNNPLTAILGYAQRWKGGLERVTELCA